MAATEQFSLCWDNFHKNISSGMSKMLENEDLIDVTLAIEGKYLKAHKMVLSLCSPYFNELFKATPCTHPIFFMKDVSFTIMSDLLVYMYRGEVQVSNDNLRELIKTAEALQIKGLTSQDEDKQVKTTRKKTSFQRNRKRAKLGDGLKKENSGGGEEVDDEEADNEQFILITKNDEENKYEISENTKKISNNTTVNDCEVDEEVEPAAVAEAADEEEEEDDDIIMAVASLDTNNDKEIIEEIDNDIDESGEVSGVGDNENLMSGGVVEIKKEKNEDRVAVVGGTSSSKKVSSNSSASSSSTSAARPPSLDGMLQGQGQGTLYFNVARTNPKIIFERFEFVVDRKWATSTNWRCPSYRRSFCKSRITTTGTEIILNEFDHNHPPTYTELEMDKFVSRSVLVKRKISSNNNIGSVGVGSGEAGHSNSTSFTGGGAHNRYVVTKIEKIK